VVWSYDFLLFLGKLGMSVIKQLGVDRETFRSIFEENWSGFKAFYPKYNTEYYEEVVQKMLCCGKEEGGYAEYFCTYCHASKRIAFTCKSSFCLSCAKVYTDNFVSQVSKTLRCQFGDVRIVIKEL
jgi:hypothetical protein